MPNSRKAEPEEDSPCFTQDGQCPVNHPISTSIFGQLRPTNLLPVTNSQERLIEPVSAKVLGTTALPEEEAGRGLEKEKTGSVRSNQWRWHLKLCDVTQKHFVLFTVCHLGAYLLQGWCWRTLY